MKTHKTPEKILRAAYHLLDKKSNWIQGEYAQDAKKQPVRWESRTRAVRFCAMGAIRHSSASTKARITLQTWLIDSLDGGKYLDDITGLNDGPQGYRRIRALFRKTAKAHGVEL